MNLEKYSKLPIDPVVTELYRQGPNIDFDFPPTAARLLDILASKLTPQSPQATLDASDYARACGYSALKAVLEGSVSAKSRNVAIYATSNRRHLVKETFSDREGDDLHRNETMQEQMSLSERFGLRVTFQKPDKETYLHIVAHLAREQGIELPEEELSAQAERFALERGGRSARCARQFVDSVTVRPRQMN